MSISEEAKLFGPPQPPIFDAPDEVSRTIVGDLVKVRDIIAKNRTVVDERLVVIIHAYFVETHPHADLDSKKAQFVLRSLYNYERWQQRSSFRQGR